MTNIRIDIVTAADQEALHLENEAFDVFGRLIVSRINEKWEYDKELFSETTTMTFPDEAYAYEQVSQNGFAVAAYVDEECVGLAVIQKDWFQYMYLMDLKVKQKYRKSGIAKLLIARAKEEAVQLGKRGIYTIGQDNNLAACLFYLNSGFRIGGLNTDVYKHTRQEGKADIYFYLED